MPSQETLNTLIESHRKMLFDLGFRIDPYREGASDFYNLWNNQVWRGYITPTFGFAESSKQPGKKKKGDPSYYIYPRTNECPWDPRKGYGANCLTYVVCFAIQLFDGYLKDANTIHIGIEDLNDPRLYPHALAKIEMDGSNIFTDFVFNVRLNRANARFRPFDTNKMSYIYFLNHSVLEGQNLDVILRAASIFINKATPDIRRPGRI